MDMKILRQYPSRMVIWNFDLIRDRVNSFNLKLLQSSSEFQKIKISGPVIIRSKNQLNVGQWYTVRIERKVKQGHMKIDNNPKIFGKSNGRTRGLNIHSPIFFGGINRKFLT